MAVNGGVEDKTYALSQEILEGERVQWSKGQPTFLEEDNPKIMISITLISYLFDKNYKVLISL